jgi:hypothetical protein
MTAPDFTKVMVFITLTIHFRKLLASAYQKPLPEGLLNWFEVLLTNSNMTNSVNRMEALSEKLKDACQVFKIPIEQVITCCLYNTQTS